MKTLLISLAVLSYALGLSQRSVAAENATKPASSRAMESATLSSNSAKSMGDHYLLLVNTSIASMMTSEKLAEFDKSPYDGLAVAFWHAYDTSEATSVAQMDAKIADWKKATKKDIWPWVYINRMIGVAPDSDNPHTNEPYFHKTKGADLDGALGAQADFLQNWQNSIHAAKDSRSPGVVCDLEFYNFYKEYDIGELSHQTGESITETTSLLRQLGAKMADIASEQYPDAALWFLFTGFTHPTYKTIDGQPYYPSPTYIAMGLLDEIQQKHFSLKVFSGGEGSLAYCHDSLEQLRDKIQDRKSKFDPQLKKYQDILELAGTMTLYSGRSEMRDWVKKDCSNSTASSLEELQPFLELLLQTYRYNWIYASGDGGYQAFAPQTATRFNSLIRKAQSRVNIKAH
jgi:hypothetical protein